jgi:hypothetical protein
MLIAHAGLLPLADKVPSDDDVVAGAWGAVMFVGLILATAFLLWSFTRQLKKTDAARDAGVFDDDRGRVEGNEQR